MVRGFTTTFMVKAVVNKNQKKTDES
jgi:hypothetical protein